MNTAPDSQRVVPVDLLPCPFCNAEPAYFSGTNIQYGHGESSDYAGVRCSVCRVEISFCNYAGYQLTERMALAAEKWNRRAAAPVAEPETGVFRLKRREFDPFDPHIQAALIALGWKSPDSATASPPATPEDRRDGERLDWLMRQVRGDEFRRIGIHTSAGCTRAAIDAARDDHEGV